MAIKTDKDIYAFKATDKDGWCRPSYGSEKQYKVGKTHCLYRYNSRAIETNISCCNTGMHCCPNLDDINNYYNLGNSEIYLVKIPKGSIIDRRDNKIASNKLHIVCRLNDAEFTLASKKYARINGRVVNKYNVDDDDIVDMIRANNEL